MNKRRRRSEIIRQLVALSRGGWHGASREDYRALEAELVQLGTAPRPSGGLNTAIKTGKFKNHANKLIRGNQ